MIYLFREVYDSFSASLKEEEWKKQRRSQHARAAGQQHDQGWPNVSGRIDVLISTQLRAGIVLPYTPHACALHSLPGLCILASFGKTRTA